MKKPRNKFADAAITTLFIIIFGGAIIAGGTYGLMRIFPLKEIGPERKICPRNFSHRQKVEVINGEWKGYRGFVWVISSPEYHPTILSPIIVVLKATPEGKSFYDAIAFDSCDITPTSKPIPRMVSVQQGFE